MLLLGLFATLFVFFDASSLMPEIKGETLRCMLMEGCMT